MIALPVTADSHRGQSLAQNYSYDNLSRLTGITERSAGTLQSYNYTGNGNRWVSAQAAGLPALTNETPQSAAAFTASPVLNRINTWSYDNNGNLKTIPSPSRTFTYDAENRQVSAVTGTATGTYAYDGNGMRVQKTVGSAVTTYVYDAFGNLAAEYSN